MFRSIKDSYKLYRENKENKISLKDYLKISAGYNKFLMNKVLEGETVTLPAKFGTLAIVGRKQKIRYNENGDVVGLAPDWVKTKALWNSNPKAKENRQRVFHTNEHSSMMRYRFHWSKARVLVTNKTLYALRMTRENKRAVNQRINKGQEYKTL